MKILLDTANLEDIRYFNTYYPIEGVTTNPTILSAEGGDVIALLMQIREIIGKDKELHVQVTEEEYDNIILEAKSLVSLLGNNTVIKVPVGDIGLKVAKALSSEGYKVTVTAILTGAQAMLASNAGATYVAPYVSRLENICDDGVRCVKDIAKIFEVSNSNTKILAASFKTAREVLDVAIEGAQCATVSSSVMRRLLAHTTTDTSIEGFKKDWVKAFGNTTLLELMNQKNK